MGSFARKRLVERLNGGPEGSDVLLGWPWVETGRKRVIISRGRKIEEQRERMREGSGKETEGMEISLMGEKRTAGKLADNVKKAGHHGCESTEEGEKRYMYFKVSTLCKVGYMRPEKPQR